MTSSVACRDWPTLTGRQSPENVHRTPGDEGRGDSAIELARRAGSKPMPWQEDQVRWISTTTPEGRWQHTDCILICPRQNGKSEIMVILVLYRLFVLRQNIIFTAHEWKTAEDLYKRLMSLVARRKSLDKKVRRATCSQGRGIVELHGGGHATFTTRSANAGRGLSKVDLLIYDEALNLQESEMAAVSFTQLAADDPQTIYTSSAVNREQHPWGEVLSSLRRTGLAGGDPHLLFSEFMAPEGMDRMDEETWRAANPSYGAFMTEAKIRKLMRGMSTDAGKRSFDVEALGRGQWFEPVEDDDGDGPVMDPDVWAAHTVSSPEVIGDSCLGLYVSTVDAGVGLVLALRTATGVHLTLAPVAEFQRKDLVTAVSKTVEAKDPVAVVMDPKGTSSTVIHPLKKAGVEPEQLTWPKVVASCELMLQLFSEGALSNDGDPRWAEALSVAEFRPGTEKGRALKDTHPAVAVLVAASFALWGLTEFEIPVAAPDVKKKRRYVGYVETVPASPTAQAASRIAF